MTMEYKDVTCPKCGGETWQDSADVGVGVIYGPRGCGDCGWSESEAYDLSSGRSPIDENGGVTDQFGGYYPPGNSVALAYRLAEGSEDVKPLFSKAFIATLGENKNEA